MVKKLPLFYFPPTLCWVDDNELFLEAAELLFKENYHCLTFSKEQEALQFLQSYQSPSATIHFTREFTESDIYDTSHHLPIDINISEITQLANRRTIQHEIGILIIDNNMPTKNGIEICYQLKNSPYKKILLTGQTSPEVVIDAFNNGIIDKFIVKDQDVSEKLKKSIVELSYQYFFEKTKNLLAHIETSRSSPLSDPVFIDFFYDWCELNQWSEFYLINKQGSFLVKDKQGITSCFIVMSEYAKEEFVKLNDDMLETDGDFLLQVAAGNSIPFFGIGKECWDFSYKDWAPYFHPAKVIEGRERYYWTEVNLEGEVR